MISIIAVIVTIAYLCYVSQIQIPSCFSETYYIVPQKWLFVAVMLFIAVACYVQLILIVPENRVGLCFAALAGMIGVIVSPYRDSMMQHNIHYISATATMSAVCLLYVLDGRWYIPVAFLLVGLRKNYLLGIETAILMAALLYKYV